MKRKERKKKDQSSSNRNTRFLHNPNRLNALIPTQSTNLALRKFGQEPFHHGAVLVHLRQLEALDLAARGAGDLLDEDYTAVQRLVAGELAPRELVDLFFGWEAMAGGEALGAHDEGAGHF